METPTVPSHLLKRSGWRPPPARPAARPSGKSEVGRRLGRPVAQRGGGGGGGPRAADQHKDSEPHWRGEGLFSPSQANTLRHRGRHLLQARRAGRTELWQTVHGAWLAARHVRAVATWPEPHGHGQGQLHAWPRGATHPVPLGSHAATCRRRAPRSLRGLTTVGSPGRSPGPLRLHSLSRNPAAPRGSSCLLIRVQGPGGHVATSWPRCSCRGCRCGALPPGDCNWGR